MTTPEQKPEKESWAQFAGMDQIDVVIIVVAVVIATIVKYRHFNWFGDPIPNWVLDFVLPFALIVIAYRFRSWLRCRWEKAERTKRWPPPGVDESSSEE
jgi:hypothetical protein